MTSGRLPQSTAGAGRGLRRRRPGHAGPGRPGRRGPPSPDRLALDHLRGQHRRRPAARLLRHPAAGAAAGLELPPPAARHRPVRRVVHVLDDAGRAARHDRRRRLGLAVGYAAASIAAGLRRDPPRDRAVRRTRMLAMNALVWVGVVLIGGCGAVARFAVDGAVGSSARARLPVRHARGQPQRRRRARPAHRAGPRRDAALLAGTAAVGSYTTFSTWLFETQRLDEARQHRAPRGTSRPASCSASRAAALGRAIGTHAVSADA